MSANDLCSTLVGWFLNRPNDVIEEIARQSGNLRLPGMRRMDPVEDATLRRDVRMAAQRLLRWSTVGPQEVFQFGFQPRVYPQANQYPAGAFNLRTYVAENHDSIFVSTTQPYRDGAGRLTRWERRITQDIWHRFEYEIFAYGGIDVNRALGVHQFDNQREIAFAGGIRPEMIRSAREYAGTQPLLSFLFHATLPMMPKSDNIQDLEIRLFLLTTTTMSSDAVAPPTILTTTLRCSQETKGTASKMICWTSHLCHLVELQALRTQGTLTGRISSAGTRYAVININPGTTGDTIALGPRDLVNNWPSLWKAGFSAGVDAILPSPNDSKEMYFFCAQNYALINIAPGTTDDYIINGPKKITNEWPSLRQAGFEKIDAVLPSPARNDEAYFFSGSQYALIRFKPGTTNDSIVNGPKPILDNWPSLKKAGFSSINTILPNPANKAEAYFFSGERYALIHIAAGSTNDYIVNGPKLVRTEWPSLKQTGFW